MEELFVFPKLFGGIGNRLFQLFTAKYYSEITGLQLRIVYTACTAEHGSNNDMFKLFPELIFTDEPESYETIIQAHSDLYTFKPFSTDVSTCIKLSGYWQVYEYCRQTLLIPNWNNALKSKTSEILESTGLTNLESQKKTWMIHFRHGDYKNYQQHYVSLFKYYSKCINEIPADSRLHVFSDEPELCRDFIESVTEGRNLVVTWSTQTKDICALYEMSHCLGGAIVANSSFSWWGAYFAKRRSRNVGHPMKAYYPSVWGYSYTDHVWPEMPDLIPDWGTKVSVD